MFDACEDWIFREAKVRLAEHRELQKSLGLKAVSDYTTLDRFERLDEALIEWVLAETIRQLKPKWGGPKATVAVTSRGLA